MFSFVGSIGRRALCLIFFFKLCCNLNPALHLEQVFAFQPSELLAVGAAGSTCRLTPQLILGPSSVAIWEGRLKDLGRLVCVNG